MTEFGSDFHSIEIENPQNSFFTHFSNELTFFSSGRSPLFALIQKNQWNRIWIPYYYCYEVIVNLLKNTDIEIAFYEDSPTQKGIPDFVNNVLPDQDVILRVNYFGLRSFRSTSFHNIPIIEDHTHDLLGEWTRRSEADWCIASLRKTLPIPEGGLLWSPKGLRLEYSLEETQENVSLSERRWRAMDLKSKYLRGEFADKDVFRKLYLETEDEFERLNLSSIDKRSREFLFSFDIIKWYEIKRRNWKLLKELVRGDFELLEPENDGCNAFSFIMLFNDRNRRDNVRKFLIAESVYPAILWNTPDNVTKEVKSFSERMLSVHCDGRYTEDDIRDLALRINRVLAL